MTFFARFLYPGEVRIAPLLANLLVSTPRANLLIFACPVRNPDALIYEVKVR